MRFSMKRLNAEPNAKIWQFPVAMLMNHTSYVINHEFVLFMKYVNQYLIRHTYRPPQSTVLRLNYTLKRLLILATAHYRAFCWRKIEGNNRQTSFVNCHFVKRITAWLVSLTTSLLRFRKKLKRPPCAGARRISCLKHTLYFGCEYTSPWMPATLGTHG